MIDPNEPAFPAQAKGSDGTPCHEMAYGITIRAHFAALALQGILSNIGLVQVYQKGGHTDPHAIASGAIAMADALIDRLNK